MSTVVKVIIYVAITATGFAIVVGLEKMGTSHRTVVGERASGRVEDGTRRPDSDNPDVLPTPLPPQAGAAPSTNPVEHIEAAPPAAEPKSTVERPINIKTAQPAAASCSCEDCQCLNVSVCRDGNCKADYIVAFGATWCGPCKAMRPVYDELRSRGIAVYELDADVHRGAVAAAKPRVFPTLILYSNGAPIERIEGTTTVEYLVRRYDG